MGQGMEPEIPEKTVNIGSCHSGGAGVGGGETIMHVMSIRAKLEEKYIRTWEEKGREGTVSSWWSAWASF